MDDYTAYNVILGYDGSQVSIPIVKAPEKTECEMHPTSGHPAEYMVDAVSQLGPAGHNLFFCKPCLKGWLPQYRLRKS